MPKIHLTKSAISKIPFAIQGQILYRDRRLPGFGLRVGTQSMAYFVEAAVNGRNVRATIGRDDLLSPECARKKARAKLVAMADGHDPVRARKRSG